MTKHGPWKRETRITKMLLCGVMLVGLMMFMAGCSYISALGGDSSNLKVQRECNVEIAQAAHVAGREESNVAETVRINERCEVEVDFKQNVDEQRIE